MIRLHYLKNSRAHRILWLLELLGEEYEIYIHERDPKTDLAPKSLEQIHPLGKSPIIQDDGIIVAESGAIVEYLIGKHNNSMRPSEPGQQRQYTYWLHFAEGSAMPLQVINLIFLKIETAQLPWYLRWVVAPIAKGISQQVKQSYLNPNLKKQLEFIDKHLASNTWFCGDQITGADIMMGFPLETAIYTGKTNAISHPNIARYVEQMHNLASYQNALEKSQGGYRFHKKPV